MKKIILSGLLSIIITAVLYAHGMAQNFADKVVSITVTSQSYDYNAPWQKLSVQKDVISGIVIKENRILTISYKLADHVLLEASKFGAYRKYPARVILKDYQCGLALIEVPDKTFFNDLKPVEFNTDGSVKGEKALMARWDHNGIFKEHPSEYLKSSVEFFNSAGAVLMHHMISDIDSGGKGEPVFVKGRLAGITAWHSPNTKTIKIIDLEVIERMLKDAGGSYKGLPYFYLEDSVLENDENLRGYLGLKDEDTGILVINVPPKTSGSDVLKKWDVILNIDGIDIDDNGLYISKKYGKLNYYGLIYLNHFAGDAVRMGIIRNKIKTDISFKLRPLSDDCFLIPTISFDAPPEFYITGGLVFQELTREYLKTWGKEWTGMADKRMMYYYDNYGRYPSRDQRRLVLLSAVLPASVNTGYHNIKNLILQKVNGRNIRDIKHVKDIIDNSKDKYILFDFTGGRRIILNSKDAKNSMKEILQKYKIQMPYYLRDNK